VIAKEKRRNPRFECSGIASVQVTDAEAPLPAKLVNLSEEGCLIVLEKPKCLPPDTIVELTFKVNDVSFRVGAQARVIRSETTIGFQFPLLSDRVRKRLADLIEQLIEDLLAKNAIRPHREQRRYPRVGCTGSAAIQVTPEEPPCPARIVDLSAGGCLMVLRQPKRLRQDELVELAFDVNHLPFRVRGQVRAVRSDTTIGFQFPQLSARVRRQLEDLIQELMDNIVKRFAKHTVAR
jgi:c-di-GMP-binding flagellar brake protein YcgR